MAAIKAYNPGSNIDIALSKPANQSSVYQNNPTGYRANFATTGMVSSQVAVDGGSNYQQTSGSDIPWVLVDLVTPQTINAIRLCILIIFNNSS